MIILIKNLKQLRLGKGISQQQLADIIGTTQQSVNKYENHSTEPDLDTLVKLAEYFETSVDYLIGHVPGGFIPDYPSMSREENALLSDYRKLNKDERKSIQLICRNYLRNK